MTTAQQPAATGICSPGTTPAPAALLNESCFCIRPDLARLTEALDRELDGAGRASVRDTHPGLYSTLPVFVSEAEAAEMQTLITAVETVVAHPDYQAAALADAPDIAARAPDVPSVLQGYDFHLTEAGPRLIEINTNAGGAMLVTELLAHLYCEFDLALPATLDAGSAREALAGMFTRAWEAARRPGPLRRIVLVDDAPPQQYLYPDMLLFRRLLQSGGIDVAIADPQELQFTGGELRHAGAPVDLVYNRLTDFYLEQPGHAPLREALLSGAAVVTPHPRAHALYANKRNLSLLTDPQRLGDWGLPAHTIATLQRHVPHTEVVRPEAAEALWARRKALFFKPAGGYGSRGSYRGDKLTRRVFADILAGDYIAQALVPPRARAADPEDPRRSLKFDVRHYVYEGEPLLQAARLYRGQTTNFRTPGGGFAPVVPVPADQG